MGKVIELDTPFFRDMRLMVKNFGGLVYPESRHAEDEQAADGADPAEDVRGSDQESSGRGDVNHLAADGRGRNRDGSTFRSYSPRYRKAKAETETSSREPAC